MKSSRILKLASLLALIQYSAHAFLFLSAKPTHGPEEDAVIRMMKQYHFNFGGFSRSYWDFYFGYGLLGILTGVFEIVVLWQLAALAKANPSHGRPMVALLILFNLAHAALVRQYFFLMPALFDIAVAACLLWAFIAAGVRNSTAAQPERSAASEAAQA